MSEKFIDDDEILDENDDDVDIPEIVSKHSKCVALNRVLSRSPL